MDPNKACSPKENYSPLTQKKSSIQDYLSTIPLLKTVTLSFNDKLASLR
jgi:hypothetical protein